MQSIQDGNLFHSAGWAVPFPFGLTLDGVGGEGRLVCHHMLRFLPGKRMVCYGTLDDRPVAAKIFFSRHHAGRHANRDEKGVKTLTMAGIPTPAIVHNDGLVGDGTRILVFEWIEDAVDLKQALMRKDNRCTPDLLERVAVLMGRMHDQGLYQADIHPDNFLVQGSSVFIIDGDNVRHRRGFLKTAVSMGNLGLLAAQFDESANVWIDDFLAIYCRQRNWQYGDELRKLLQQHIRRQRARRRRKYLKKVMRECSAYVCRRSKKRKMICDRRFDTPRMRQLLENPDHMMASGSMLKDGNSATVVRLKIDGHDLVAKRYNIKGPGHYLRRCLRPSRAAVSWGNAHHLRFLGIDTPLPVAFAETRYGPLRSSALLVMRYVGGQNLYDRLHRSEIPADEVTRLIHSFGNLLECLGRNRISHGDFKATNFIVAGEKLYLVDLDAMARHRQKWLYRQAARKDVNRFLKNWDDRPDIRRLVLQYLLQKRVSSLPRILPEDGI